MIWNEELIKDVISLKEEGKTWVEIGKLLKVSSDSVRKAVNNFEEKVSSYYWNKKDRIVPRSIVYKKSDFTVVDDCIYLIPFGDLHTGDFFHNDKLTKGYIEWILNHKNAYLILSGDEIQAYTKKYPSNLVLSPIQQVMAVSKYLKPIKDRILGIHGGTHPDWIKHESKTDLTELLAEILGIPKLYRPEGLFIYLDFGKVTYKIYSVHGKSAGRAAGAKINVLRTLRDIVEADIYIHSHTHFASPHADEVFVFNEEGELEQRRRYFVNIGGFQEWGGYLEKGVYSPARLGTIRIRLNTKRNDVHLSF